MRTYKDYEAILELWELGFSKKRIALITNIPRATVRDCIQRFGSLQGLEQQTVNNGFAQLHSRICNADNPFIQQAYAYLLGLFLGDGEISKNRNIFRLRIALDKRYPNIIQACIQAVQIILPDNQVGIVDSSGCVYVSCYHKFWPEIFPQHGVGRKHDRPVILHDWQQQIVKLHPLELFRGLYHSDGSRFSNVEMEKITRATRLPTVLTIFVNYSATPATGWAFTGP